MTRRLSILLIFITSLLSITAQKTNLFIKDAVKKEMSLHRKPHAKGLAYKEKSITAFIRCTDSKLLHENGCKILAQWDDIYIASIPLNRVNILLSNPSVLRIEAGRSCSMTNDTTAMKLHTRELWQRKMAGIEGLTGKGTVVGVMDVGFDLTHPTYLSQDGTRYRIQRLWDMLDYTEGGHAVEGEDTTYVGRQYMGEEELLGKQHSADGLTETHGTHTSGTAAGSGREGNGESDMIYAGSAPDADICLVANACGDNGGIIPEEDLYKYTTATDMLGFKYIFDYAESQGKPCVISFSEGSYENLYDDELYNEVLSKMLGPGRILCTAAGNEGTKLSYLHKPAGQEKAGAFLYSSSANALYTMKSSKPVRMKLVFYNADGDEKKEWFYYTEGLKDYPDSVMADTVRFKDIDFPIMVETYPSCYDSIQYATDLLIQDGRKWGFGQLGVYVSLTLMDEDNDIEAFHCGGWFTTNEKDPSLADAEQGHNILFPSSCEDVISVGATAYVNMRYNYLGELKKDNDIGADMLYPYTSIGPTIDGRTKPDVVAPGQSIVSSYSSFYLENNPTANDISWDVRHFEYNGRIYPWNSNSGTSMACPAVAGIIALWLQICPTLTPDQIKDVLAHSCSHIIAGLDYPNNTYGYGQIDAVAGAEYIEKVYCGIECIEGKDSIEGSERYYTLDGVRQPNGNIKGVVIVRSSKGARKIIR